MIRTTCVTPPVASSVNPGSIIIFETKRSKTNREGVVMSLNPRNRPSAGIFVYQNLCYCAGRRNGIVFDENIVQVDAGRFKVVREDENRRIPGIHLPIDLIAIDNDPALVSPCIHHYAGSGIIPCSVGVDDVVLDAGVGGISQLEAVGFERLKDVALYRPVGMISPFTRITVFIIPNKHTIIS